MISPLSSALSAISAFGVNMRVTANNIANVNTDGFKQSRTTFSEGDPGGVVAHVDQDDSPGGTRQSFVDGQVVDVETSNVDLSAALTETIPTKIGYRANLKTIRTQDEMLGSLLDIIG